MNPQELLTQLNFVGVLEVKKKLSLEVFLLTPESQELDRDQIYKKLGHKARGKNGIELKLSDSLAAKYYEGVTTWKNGRAVSYSRAEYILQWPGALFILNDFVYFRRVYSDLSGQWYCSPVSSYGPGAKLFGFKNYAIVGGQLGVLKHYFKISKFNNIYQSLNGKTEFEIKLDETNLYFDLKELGKFHFAPDRSPESILIELNKAVVARHREAEDKEFKLKALKEFNSILVLPEDSIRAGNCQIGTKQFAFSNGVNSLNYDRAEWLCGMFGAELINKRNDSYSRRALVEAYRRETMVSI